MELFDNLTEKQLAVYEFIRDKIRTRGYGPTVREIGANFNIKSPNGVVCHLKALEKKGIITREPNMRGRSSWRPSRSRTTACHSTGKSPPACSTKRSSRKSGSICKRSSIRPIISLFVLEVRGESMIEDQIADGDYVVVRRQRTARKGQIVVAITDEGEATLKRWYQEKNRIRLEPANSTMKPIYVRDAKVLGVVVGVVRKVE